MFQGFSQQTIDFMWNIRFNNEKIWFEAHKEEYKTVLQQPMNALASEVYSAFSEKFPDIDLTLHVSRIYRDARRLHGNGPYRDHLWFSLRKNIEEWQTQPVFWFGLEPETWDYGLGFYSAKAETMAKHRARIDNHSKEIEKLARDFSNQTELVLGGENFKRPKGEPGGLLNNWYNKKSLYFIHQESINEAVFSADLVKRVADGFAFLVPYYRYLSSLDSDPD